jgi:hypothetical protein
MYDALQIRVKMGKTVALATSNMENDWALKMLNV